MSSEFSQVTPGAPIEIFQLSQRFRNDTFEKKVDLGVGAYRTNEAKPWVLPVVRRVEQEMAADETLNHEYLTILGLEAFSVASTKMLLGESSPALTDGRAFGIQVLSGTGALRVGADFLSQILGRKSMLFSAPSWPNHSLVFKQAGFTDIKTYRYWDEKNRSLDFNGMIDDLKGASPGTVVILHACAHNPTGIDPSDDQWEKIADVMAEHKLFPFFDCAYQGFASGDLEKDARTVRSFVNRGFELFCAQSFAKNFGLYNERAGNLVVVTSDKTTIPNIRAQLTIIVRGNYSNPPNHGARIVLRILTDDKLFEEWKGCIKTMANRINEMRAGLKERLVKLQTPGSWDHVTSQIGMFSFTGLTDDQVKYLVDECHIYMTKNGRISICGLNTNNLDYVASCIKDAVIKFPAPAAKM